MAEPYPSRSASLRLLQGLGNVVLVVACLYWAQRILIPLAMAILLTFILTPFVMRLQRRGLGRVPSVVLVVLVTFALLGGLCWGVTAQTRKLLVEIPKSRGEIEKKIQGLTASSPNPVGEFVGMINDITERVQGKGSQQAAEGKEAQPVRLVNTKTDWSWLTDIVRPALEVALDGFFVAILVIFMLAKRENLRNRFFQAVGHGRINLTTRAVDEASQRVSRYLMTQLFINVGFGLLWAISLFLVPNGEGGYGVPYAFLWGCLAAALRFIPYVGTWVALLFPLALSFALSPLGHPWLQPILLTLIYAVLELVTANAVEPLVFGHNTGVSPVALLVAAVFWAWLWGPLGLVLSTPLTVCLVVMGKYIPQLALFNVLMGTDAAQETEFTYYQRLLARDEDEAAELVQEYLKKQPLDGVYDEVLIPTLVLAKRDAERGGLEPQAAEFLFQATGRILDEVVGHQQHVKLVASGKGKVTETGELVAPEGSKLLVLGCPARGEADELALRMLAQLLEGVNYQMEIISTQALTSEVVEKVRAEGPGVVCIASLPPGGLSQASYLCKRLRLHFPDLKIIVGRWGQSENVETTHDRLKEAGATHVVTTLLEAQREIVPLARLATAAVPSGDGQPSASGVLMSGGPAK